MYNVCRYYTFTFWIAPKPGADAMERIDLALRQMFDGIAEAQMLALSTQLHRFQLCIKTFKQFCEESLGAQANIELYVYGYSGNAGPPLAKVTAADIIEFN